MRSALVIVDVQRDFLDGSLGGEGRDQVVAPLLAAAKRADVVVASMDWHPSDHFSFVEHPMFVDGSWPAHCVQGTDGAKLDERVAALHPTVFRKGVERTVEAYSAFAGVDEYHRQLNAHLSMHGVQDVVVGGFCTDFCVRATALDAVKFGYRTFLLVEGCAGVDPVGTDAALRDMERAGVTLV